VIEKGWEEEIKSFAAKGENRAGVFRMRFGGDGIGPRLREGIAAVRFWLSGRPLKGQALLISAKLLEKAGGFASTPPEDEAELMRRLGGDRVIMLKAAVFVDTTHRP
jgi:hypothetical protein